MTLHALHGRDEVIESVLRAPDQHAGLWWILGRLAASLWARTQTVFAQAEAELSAAAAGQQVATTTPTNKYSSHVRMLSWLRWSWTYNDRIIPGIRKLGLLKQCFILSELLILVEGDPSGFPHASTLYSSPKVVQVTS
jgi:hypothetical protein